MARQSRLRKLEGGPQGDGHYIVVIIATMGELRHQQKEIARLREQYGDNGDEVIASANCYIANHIAEWNWIGDDGLVMPMPRTNPEIIDDLTQEEIEFIGLALNGRSAVDEENRKK